MPIDALPGAAAGCRRPAGNLHDLMYPPEKVFKGGEGIAKIVKARENETSPFAMFKNKYW